MLRLDFYRQVEQEMAQEAQCGKTAAVRFAWGSAAGFGAFACRLCALRHALSPPIRSRRGMAMAVPLSSALVESRASEPAGSKPAFGPSKTFC